MLKRTIRKVISFIFEGLYPDLKMLSSESKSVNDPLQNNLIGKKVKVYAPYNIMETEIGDYTYIAQNSLISITEIGKFCSIGPNFFCGYGIHPTNGISTHPMFYSTLKQNGYSLSKTDKIEERKRIKIGNDVFIGANVTVLDGVTIGNGAVIGAGAVVSKDIPPYAIAVGVPIEVIKFRFDDVKIAKLLKIKWWDEDETELSKIESNLFNIEKYLCEKQN